jgi:hypothetical protein
MVGARLHSTVMKTAIYQGAMMEAIALTSNAKRAIFEALSENVDLSFRQITFELLSTILDFTFQISNRAIEGQRVKIDLLISTHPDSVETIIADRWTHWGAYYTPFDVLAPTELTFERLKPILQCITSPSSFLVIEPKDDGSLLRVGLLYVGSSLAAVCSINRTWARVKWTPELGPWIAEVKV